MSAPALAPRSINNYSCYTGVMFATILSYLLSIPVLVALDLGWVGFIMKGFYRTRLAQVLSPTVNWPPLVGFYLLFSIGIFYFAAYPAHMRGSVLAAIGAGFLLGLVAYGTYDFTNMATLPSWPLSVTIVYILWGGVIAAIVATAGYYLLALLS
jgi:uncharacterized membrane protein